MQSKNTPTHLVQQLQLIEALRGFYRNNRDNLSQVSANLNNAVKRANELALSGHLTQTYFTETLLPQIIRTRIFLESLTRQLPTLNINGFKIADLWGI